MIALLLFLLGQGLLFIGAYLLNGVFGWHVALGLLASFEGIATIVLGVANASTERASSGRPWYE